MKPREFWIDVPQGDEDAIVYQFELEGCIHVIEYSAYEALKTAVGLMGFHRTEEWEPLQKERDKLRADLKLAVEALETIKALTHSWVMAEKTYECKHTYQNIRDVVREVKAKLQTKENK